MKIVKTILKEIGMTLLPFFIFFLVVALLMFGAWQFLKQQPQYDSWKSTAENAIDVLKNGKEETPDTLTRAQPTDAVITLPAGVDSTASFEVTLDDGTLLPEEGEEVAPTPVPEEGAEVPPDDGAHSMYVVFNGISNRETSYFYAPTGTLTLTAKATGESTGMKSFKIALWEKLAGETQYVADTTIYFYTNDETNTYTITGLDPTIPYRLNFSYDAYGYYIYGVMQVDGVSFDAPVVPEEPATQAE